MGTAWRRLHRITVALAEAREQLATARLLRQRPRSSQNRAAARPEHVWLGELLEGIDRRPRQESVWMLNERLADVARDTDVGADVPRVSARIALTAGTMMAILALVQGLNSVEASWAGATFIAGIASALLASECGRRAKASGKELLDAWNGVVRAISPLLPTETTGDPGPAGEKPFRGVDPEARSD